MKEITSTQNPEIKEIASLKDHKGREAHKLFLVEGVRSLETFLDAQWYPKRIFVTHDFYEHSDFLQNRQLPVILVSAEVMAKISSSKTPCGIAGVFKIPEESHQSLQPGLVLAGISDPGNMGTLIRTTAAFDLPSIVVIEGCDPWSPKVVQASAGAHALVSIIRLSWHELIAAKENLLLCALVAQAEQPAQTADLCDALLVVGNEAHGIPEEWLRQCDALVSLPMPGKTESLNAAVAGALALYIRFAACNES